VTHLGRRVESEVKPGHVGTVLNENAPAGRWPRSEQSFDVLWDDGSCSRLVARSIIEGPGWKLRPDARRARSECHEMWWQWLISRARQLGVQHGRAPATATPPPRPMQVPLPQSFDLPLEAPAAAPPAKSARLAREQARDVLGAAFPKTAFSLHCERRVLSVTWVDGPLPGDVWKCLQARLDHRAVERIRNDRTISEPLLQAAVDYCLWHAIPDESERARIALRVNALGYQDGSLNGLFAAGGAGSGLCYRDLVRVVIDRWDDETLTFRPTRSTTGLVGECAAMFPNGLGPAAEQFKLFRSVAASALQRSRDAVDTAGREAMRSLSSGRRLERQRP
jgi:hypothetical protein